MYKNGDEKAFNALYKMFCKNIFSYCIRILGDFHDAEDVLVETFTKLARSKLSETGSLQSWLYRVATNGCYRTFRKYRKEVEFDESRFKEQGKDHGPGLIREMRIQKLLSSLPDNQRIVIVLKFYENLKYDEIAEILCCPPGTVKSRMHGGLKNLRRRLYEMHTSAGLLR